MRLTWNSRLTALVLAVAFVLGGVSFAAAQDQPAKPTLAFTNDAGLIIFYIKPDKTADFEGLMAKLKEGLGKLDAPEAKQQVASLKLFKNKVADGATVAIYVLVADPAVKDVEYLVPPDPVQDVPRRGQGPVRQVAGRQGGDAGAADDFRPHAGPEVSVQRLPRHRGPFAASPSGRATSSPDPCLQRRTPLRTGFRALCFYTPGRFARPTTRSEPEVAADVEPVDVLPAEGRPEEPEVAVVQRGAGAGRRR